MTGINLDVLYSILGITVNQPANWSRVLFCSWDDSLSQVKCLGSCKARSLVPWLVASTTRSCVVDSSGEGRKTGRGNQRGDGREEGSALGMEGRCDHLVKWIRLVLRVRTIKASIWIIQLFIIYIHIYMYVYESLIYAITILLHTFLKQSVAFLIYKTYWCHHVEKNVGGCTTMC